jgi:hypothetical protein
MKVLIQALSKIWLIIIIEGATEKLSLIRYAQQNFSYK